MTSRRFPFGLPDGWFPVAYSDELAPGAVLRARYFARELVIFRTESGRAAVLDAHCPHLGAHLGVGGKVVGETIQCPFHGWQYGADGACVKIPYAAETPSGVRARAWPVVERNGAVLVWHDAEGRAPRFEIPTFPEWQAEDWTASYERYTWQVQTHPQEVMENAIDWPHFERVHAMVAPHERTEKFEGPLFEWTIGASKLVRTLDNTRDNFLIHSQNWGLGYAWLRYSGMFKTVVFTGLTPVDHETTEIRFGIIGKRDGRSDAQTRDVLKAYMDDQARAIEQDFAIWENKIYRPDPPLCDGDGPVRAYRKWAGQFYSGAEAPASA